MSKLNPQNATAYVGPGVLRKGGKITPVPNGPLIKKKGPYAGSTLKNGGPIKKAQNGIKELKDLERKKDSIYNANRKILSKEALKNIELNEKQQQIQQRAKLAKKKAKAGAMIKRADGSMSRRGLWDNIRANKGSGKKPTAAMLKQEKKIKAKAKK